MEASIRSRTKNRSSEYQVELVHRDSASCQNCPLLLRRVQDLESRLFRVASRQDQEACIQPGRDQNQGSFEEEQQKRESRFPDPLQRRVPVLMDPCSAPTAADHLSPGEVRVDDSWEVLDPELAPLSPDSSDSESSSPDRVSASTRPRFRFRPGWLKTFPFLRFSPTQNLMWCHVCRVYADGIYRNHGLIRGSDRFLKFSLTIHSSRQYHLRNMERYQARFGPGPGPGEP